MARKHKGFSKRRSEASGIHLWLVLWRASRALEARARRSIARLGMCPSDFGVLEALLHKGPQSISALGAKVLLTSGSMTVAVDRLERIGFARRGAAPRDRRSRVASLTPRGRRVMQQAFAQHEKAMEQAAAALNRKERATAIALLRKLGQSAAQTSPD